MKKILLLLLCLFIGSAYASTVTFTMYRVAKVGHGAKVGTVKAVDTHYGLLLEPKLTGLSPGIHGFHLHEMPSCDKFGKAAGGHFDPNHTGKHLGPYNAKGHLGDLPPLFVDQKGRAWLPVLAPRLTVKDLKGHALMIHAGHDNFSDHPAKLGGGGGRVICGLVNERD